MLTVLFFVTMLGISTAIAVKATYYTKVENVTMGIRFNVERKVPDVNDPNVTVTKYVPAVVGIHGDVFTTEGARMSIGGQRDVGALLDDPLTPNEIYQSLGQPVVNNKLQNIFKDLYMAALEEDVKQ
jgi:hypothetical protein